MQIFIHLPIGYIFKLTQIPLEIELTDLIIDLKKKIEYKLGIFFENQELKYCGQVLKDDTTVQNNSIINDSKICLEINSILYTYNQAKYLLMAHRYQISNMPILNDLNSTIPKFLDYRSFFEEPDYIKNFYPAYTDFNKDYVYQTCKAYIDTIYKIYGSPKPEKFSEIYAVADYEGNNSSYSPKKSVDLLEKAFHHGILSHTTDALTIRDAMTMSVIVQFSTSKKGYEEIKKGSLIEKAKGIETEFFVVLIKEYDFGDDCMICSFANGYEFKLRASAAHKIEFIILYFTTESIEGKTSSKLIPRFEKAQMCYDCADVDCYWMNEETAAYSLDYVFAYRPYVNREMPYFGIEINQYIFHHSMLSNKRKKPEYVDCKKANKPLLA